MKKSVLTVALMLGLVGGASSLMAAEKGSVSPMAGSFMMASAEGQGATFAADQGSSKQEQYAKKGKKKGKKKKKKDGDGGSTPPAQ